jgi:hypothetical protein
MPRCLDKTAWSRGHVLAAMFFGTAAGALLGACFNPPDAAAMFTCDPEDAPACPPDYACEADGCCHRAGSDVAANLGACRLGGPDTASMPTGTSGDTSGGTSGDTSGGDSTAEPATTTGTGTTTGTTADTTADTGTTTGTGTDSGTGTGADTGTDTGSTSTGGP